MVLVLVHQPFYQASPANFDRERGASIEALRTTFFVGDAGDDATIAEGGTVGEIGKRFAATQAQGLELFVVTF